MNPVFLQNPYPSVRCGTGASYGGDQGRSESRLIRRSGCGIISSLDFLLYVSRYRPGCRMALPNGLNAAEPADPAAYYALAQQLCRRYFPLVPSVGLNAYVMALGLNRIFLHHHLPLHAHWGVRPGRFWPEIERMLADGLPVILSIGPNFPLIWQKHRCGLYRRTADGSFQRACAVKAHYVNAIGLDDDWLYISSWGREYAIDRVQYMRYVEQHSSFFVSNLMSVSTRNRHCMPQEGL